MVVFIFSTAEGGKEKGYREAGEGREAIVWSEKKGKKREGNEVKERKDRITLCGGRKR